MKFSDNVNYRPYLYGKRVIILSAREANVLYQKEEKEYIDFFAKYGLSPDKAIKAAELAFKRHIV